MALFFITGAPGSGKTTVTGEMERRGLSVHDTDDPNHTGMAGWHDLSTGEYVAGFNEREVTASLLETHQWRLADGILEDFQAAAAEARIYLCGRLKYDEDAVIAASQRILFLTVDAETIENRLVERSKSSSPDEVAWGREQWQISQSIEVNEKLEEKYRALGAVMINTLQPPAMVVNDIISATITHTNLG